MWTQVFRAWVGLVATVVVLTWGANLRAGDKQKKWRFSLRGLSKSHSQSSVVTTPTSTSHHRRNRSKSHNDLSQMVAKSEAETHLDEVRKYVEFRLKESLFRRLTESISDLALASRSFVQLVTLEDWWYATAICATYPTADNHRDQDPWLRMTYATQNARCHAELILNRLQADQQGPEMDVENLDVQIDRFAASLMGSIPNDIDHTMGDWIYHTQDLARSLDELMGHCTDCVARWIHNIDQGNWQPNMRFDQVVDVLVQLLQGRGLIPKS